MKVRFRIESVSPLLMHRDDVEWSDTMKEWSTNPDNASKSVAGDDRTPAFRWCGSLYHDGQTLTVPSDCLAACLGGAGKQIKTGKGGKTFKDAAASGMVITTEHLALLVNGKPIKYDKIAALVTDQKATFDQHKKVAEGLGFSLDVRRARINQTKHVRVRPRFDAWAIEGELEVWREEITLKVLTQMFEIAGARVGIGDWRPSSPKAPGPFGRFKATLKEVA